jgi:hypothetical protein
MQVLVAGLFTVLMAVALTAAKPYEQPWYNVIQVLQMVLVVFVGFSGLVFYSTLVSAATVDVLTVSAAAGAGRQACTPHVRARRRARVAEVLRC